MALTFLGVADLTLCINFIEALRHKDNGTNFLRCRYLNSVY